MNYKAWVAKAAKQPMVLETVDLGPLGAEEVEAAVEYCGLEAGFLTRAVFLGTRRFRGKRA